MHHNNINVSKQPLCVWTDNAGEKHWWEYGPETLSIMFQHLSAAVCPWNVSPSKLLYIVTTTK